VVQDAGEPGIRPFRHPRHVERGLALRRIEVDVEVVGLDDLEVELGVLDLVLAEVSVEVILCLRGGGHDEGEHRHRQREPQPATEARCRHYRGKTTGASPQRRSSW
jgi:hypothetical protein